MGVQRIAFGTASDVSVEPVVFATSCDVQATLPAGIPDVDEKLACAVVSCRPDMPQSGVACLECSRYRGWRDGPGLDHITVHCSLTSNAPVCELMTSDVIAVTPGATLGELAAAMRRFGLATLPVVDHGVLVGVVTRGDLARAGVPHELLGDAACIFCGSKAEVRSGLHAGLDVCQACLEVEDELENERNLGQGD